MSSPELPGRIILDSPGPSRLEMGATSSSPWTIVPVAGPKGDQGDPGTPGGSYYVHTQATPAATWVINHGLAKKVHVTIFDLADAVVHADIAHGTANQATITFPSPVAGSAVIS